MESPKMLYKPIDFRFGGLYESSNPLKTSLQPSKADPNSKIPLSVNWPKVFAIGPGFRNLGNTCFFNSVLQCITYTPPLVGYFLHPKAHNPDKCNKEKHNCWLCLLSSHYNFIFGATKAKTLSPVAILKCLRTVWKKFRLGSQEDSHEFLRIFLDSVQKAEKWLINGVFSGTLKNQVECLDCKGISEKSDPFLDLSLEVQKSDSIQKSLEIFFKKESLSGNNKYRCGKCKKLVNALKGFHLEEGPMILTIQLKRFNNSLMKINKYVRFTEKLELTQFMINQKKPVFYDLYAVVVHQGSQMWSGHYYSYVKNSNNMWYLMNDETVRLANLERVLKENAYLLFYVRRDPPMEKTKILANGVENHTNNITKTSSVEDKRKKSIDKGMNEHINGNMEADNYGGKLSKVKETEEGRNYLDLIFKRTSSQIEENSKNNELKTHQLSRSFSLNTEEKKFNEFAVPLTKLDAPSQKNSLIKKVNPPEKINNEEVKLNEIHKESSKMEEEHERNGVITLPTLTLERSLSKSSMQGTKRSKLRKMKMMELWGDIHIKKIKTNNPTETPIKICSSDKKLEKLKTINEIFESKVEEFEENDSNGLLLLEAKKKVLEKNPDFLQVRKKEKDAYDVEYDKGKLKKKRNKKELKKNDFQEAFKMLKKHTSKNGFVEHRRGKSNRYS